MFTLESNNSGYGNTVIIEHIGANGEPYYSLYGHLNGEDMPEVGQRVKSGEKIGEVGHTGRTQGNNFHFEIIVPDGFYVDENGNKWNYFLNNRGEREYINSDLTSPYGQFVSDNGNIPIGLNPGVGRREPTGFDNWPSSGAHNRRGSSGVFGGRGSYITPPDYGESVERTEEETRRGNSSRVSSSGETLERRGKKVWRIEDDGGTRGYVKPWSK